MHKPKVLFLVDQCEDPVIDSLIAGFLRVGYTMGADMMVFPAKPHLFLDPKVNYQSIGLSAVNAIFCVSDIADQLARGCFDLVIISGIWQFKYMREMYAYLLNLVADTPCVIVTEKQRLLDSYWKFRTDLNLLKVFYRHKYPDYDGLSISWSIMEERTGSATKTRDTFFAGRTTPMRKPYTDALKAAGYKDIHEKHVTRNYSEYLALLRSSKVTFCFPADGYNLSRLQRNPAQTTCLLSHDHRKFIEVRDDFTHEQNIIFFDDPDDMIVKLEDILSDPGRLNAIAEAGFEHVTSHHLVQHSAKYVLGVVEELL